MKLAILASIISFISTQAFANAGFYAGGQFGIGMHGGAGICAGYDGRIPEGVADIEDDLQELYELKADVKAKRSKNKRKRKSLEAQIEARMNLVCASGAGLLTENICTGIENHMKNGWSGSDQYTAQDGGRVCNPPADATNVLGTPWPTFCDDDPVDGDYAQDDAIDWMGEAVAPGEGKINVQVCDHNEFYDREKYNNGTVKNCKESITKLMSLHDEFRGLESDAVLDARYAEIKARIAALKLEKKEIIREARDDETEADYCYTCQYRNDKPISTAEKIGSIAAGLGIAYLGYRGVSKIYKYGIDQANKLGYPATASPLAVASAMGPFVNAGLYGALHGFGGGSSNCGPNPMGIYGPGGVYGAGNGAFGGGAFGYPAGYGGGMGGGMYMGGVGPWGMNGPFGGGIVGPYGVPMVGGYPISGGGMIAGGGFGLIGGGGMMMGGYPIAGGMIAGGYPIAGGGMIMGGGLGLIGGGGMMMGGYPISGGGMMMGGYPISGGGMMMGGGMIGGLGLITGGYPAGGGGMMAAPYPISGGGMMMGAYPISGGGMMMGGQAGLQFQQQMMQMQQQQTQLWIQQQQRAQQDYYNRQQTVSQLQNQLVQIQMQIQQVQYGVYGSGFSSGGGVQVAPFPGQTAPFPGQPGAFPGQQFPGQTPPFFPPQNNPTNARGRR